MLRLSGKPGLIKSQEVTKEKWKGQLGLTERKRKERVEIRHETQYTESRPKVGEKVDPKKKKERKKRDQSTSLNGGKKHESK